MPETRTRAQRMLEERANLWEQMKEITELADAEKRDLTGEEEQKWDKCEADMRSLTEKIERWEKTDKLDKEMNRTVEDPRLEGIGEPRKGAAAGEEERQEQAAREMQVFGDFMRHGLEGLNAEDRQFMQRRYQRPGENRAQSEGTTTAGGYLVPQGYWLRIAEVLKAYGGLLGIANVITTGTGNPLPWPNNDDTAHVGSILGENTQVSEVDLTVGQRILNAWTYTSNLVLVSLELIQDSAFDLDAWIPKKLGQRLGRGVAADLVTGAGSTKPIGMAYSPTVGVTGATGETVTISYNNLVDLEHSVDAAYRQLGNCRFLMNDLSIAVIRKITDSYGHPLWQPSIQIGNPNTLLGYPTTIDNSMPVMAANAYSVAFGDFEMGYVVRQVLAMQMMRLTERYADYLQVGFFGFLRLDGRPDDPNAVKFFQNSAT